MASYSYTCSNCGKSFQSMKQTTICIYCAKSTVSEKNGVSRSSSNNNIYTDESTNNNGGARSSSSSYIVECTVCHYKEESPSVKSSCGRCNSSSVKSRVTDGYESHDYTCSACNSTFTTLGEAHNCTSCLSTDIHEGTNIKEDSPNSYTCNSCNYTFSSEGVQDSCRRCSSTDLQSKASSYTTGGKGLRMATEDATTPGYSTNDSDNLYDGGGAVTPPPVTDDTSNNNNNSNGNKDDDDDNKPGGILGAIGNLVTGLVDNVTDFFDKFRTTEEDEKDYVNSFLKSSDGNLANSIYGGAFGTWDDGSNVEDEELAKNLQDMEDTSGSITENVPMNDNVFGRPLYYNAFADPCKSAFNQSIMYDAPIISFIPGKPKVNRKLIDTAGSKIVDLDEYYETLEDGSGSDVLGILNPKGTKDLRYLSFKSNYPEYWKYVQFLTSYTHNWMIAKDSEAWDFQKYNISTDLKNKYSETYGLLFYADRSTTISESASNSYSTSRVAEMVNEKSSITREASMVGKYNNFSEFATNLSQNISGMIEGTMTGIESLKSFEGVLSKTANSFMKVVNGAQLDFPEMWQDSKFDRSYSVSFRFYSPYGDRASIEKFVYTPFLALLALTLSRQDQAFSYVEPFLVRVDAPGWIQPLHIVIYVE